MCLNDPPRAYGVVSDQAEVVPPSKSSAKSTIGAVTW